MRYLKGYSWILAGVMALASGLQARVLSVGQNGTYGSIRAAINDAQNGDTISVASGTPDTPAVYREVVDFQGKNVLLAAREVGSSNWRDIDNPDPRATVITKPEGPDTFFFLVLFTHREQRTATLRGFTIRDISIPNLSNMNLHDPYFIASAILIFRSSPTIERCIVEHNIGAYGGGLRAHGVCSPLIRNTIFKNNASQLIGGGAIAVTDSAKPVILSCLFFKNRVIADIFGRLNQIPQQLEDQVPEEGAGVAIFRASAYMINCTIDSNAVSRYPLPSYKGAGVYVKHGYHFELYNTLVTRNYAVSYLVGVGVRIESCRFVNSDYNLYWGNESSYQGFNEGQHTFFIDPLYEGPGNHHLKPESPAIDSGTNCVWEDWDAQDLEGHPRFVDGRNNLGEWYAIQVDRGAFEYQMGTALHCGDVDRDGIDARDMDDPKYLYHYLSGDPGYEICPLNVADVNEDGSVDMADFTYLDHYTQYGYPEPCNPPFGGGDKQALLATGEPQVQNQTLTLPVYGYLEEKSAGYLLEFEVPDGFTFTGASLSPQAPADLVLRVQEDGGHIRLLVADTVAEDGIAYLEAGTQELIRLYLTYEGDPVGFVLTGEDLQFADTSGMRMLSGFVTGGTQAYVTLKDLATRIRIVGSPVVQKTLRVSFQIPRTWSHATVALYDASGRKVTVLYEGPLTEGIHEMAYDVSRVHNGVYFLRVQAEEFRHVEKVVVLR